MQEDFFEGLEVQLTEEQEKENEELNRKSEPLFNYISAALGFSCGFTWEFAPGTFQALVMGGEQLAEAFGQLIAYEMIFPVPGLRHKKYGRLFIVAESPRKSKKIRKKLLKLQHLFPKEGKIFKGENIYEDSIPGNPSNERFTH